MTDTKRRLPKVFVPPPRPVPIAAAAASTTMTTKSKNPADAAKVASTRPIRSPPVKNGCLYLRWRFANFQLHEGWGIATTETEDQPQMNNITDQKN